MLVDRKANIARESEDWELAELCLSRAMPEEYSVARCQFLDLVERRDSRLQIFAEAVEA